MNALRCIYSYYCFWALCLFEKPSNCFDAAVCTAAFSWLFTNTINTAIYANSPTSRRIKTVIFNRVPTGVLYTSSERPRLPLACALQLTHRIRIIFCSRLPFTYLYRNTSLIAHGSKTVEIRFPPSPHIFITVKVIDLLVLDQVYFIV